VPAEGGQAENGQWAMAAAVERQEKRFNDTAHLNFSSALYLLDQNEFFIGGTSM